MVSYIIDEQVSFVAMDRNHHEIIQTFTEVSITGKMQ